MKKILYKFQKFQATVYTNPFFAVLRVLLELLQIKFLYLSSETSTAILQNRHLVYNNDLGITNCKLLWSYCMQNQLLFCQN